MSPITVDSVLSANDYNKLVIDHDATDRAEQLDLKKNHLSGIFDIIAKHGLGEAVDPHLLHRHFALHKGEAVLRRTLDIPASGGIASLCVDLAKAMTCTDSMRSSLVSTL